MAGLLDLIKGLNGGIQQGIDTVVQAPKKITQAVSSPQGKQVLANLARISLEKKKKEEEDKARVQALINSQMQASNVQGQTISAPSSAPLDVAQSGLASLQTRFDPVQQLTKNIGDGYNAVREPIVNAATQGIMSLNPLNSLLARLKANNPIESMTKGAVSGALTKTFEDPVKNFSDNILLARNKFQTGNKNLGDYANATVGTAADTAGLAMSAIPFVAQYNAGVGALQGNERTKPLGDAINTIGSLPTQGLEALVSKLPVSDEVKKALVMGGNLGLLKVGSKLGEKVQTRINDAGYKASLMDSLNQNLARDGSTFNSGPNFSPIIKALVNAEKSLVKNPVVQALDPTGLTTGLGATTKATALVDPLINDAVDITKGNHIDMLNIPSEAIAKGTSEYIIDRSIKQYKEAISSGKLPNDKNTASKQFLKKLQEAKKVIVTNEKIRKEKIKAERIQDSTNDIISMAREANQPKAGKPPIPPIPPKTSANIAGEEMQKNNFDPEQYVKEQIMKRENAKKNETPSVKDRIMNAWSNIKTKLVDSTAPIEDILYNIKNQNKKNFSLLPSKDIHNQIDRVFRTTDIAGQFMRDNGLDSVIKGVDNLDNLDQYLVAKHGQTLTKNGVETGRDPVKDAALVDSFAPKYEAQARQVTAYSRKLLDYAVDAGIVSKETAQALKEKYPDYVPFNRVFNDDGTFNSVGGKAVASLGKQSVIQKIVGSKREVESPLQSLLQKTHEVFTQGEKNKAGKILSEYSSFDGNPFQLKKINEVKDKADGMDTISFYKDGVKEIWETTPEIAQAAKSLGVQQLNILGKIFAAPVRIARIGITGLNIPFIGANIVKDQVSAFINSKNSLRTSAANPKVFIQSLFSAVGHDKLYQEMVREGGGGTSFNMSRSNAGKTLEQIRAGRNIGSSMKYTVTHPSQLLKAVEDIVSRGEEFTRISQYKGTKDAMIAKGMNEKEARTEAARQARDTTVNFARKGE